MKTFSLLKKTGPYKKNKQTNKQTNKTGKLSYVGTAERNISH